MNWTIPALLHYDIHLESQVSVVFPCTGHQRLQAQVKELDQQRRFTSQAAASGSECTSPSISLTSLDNSDDGDAEQAWIKYREMKVRQLPSNIP